MLRSKEGDGDWVGQIFALIGRSQGTMRVTWRWLYTHDSLPQDSFPSDGHPGLCFTDHVTRDGGNDVAVITGIVKVFSSVDEMNADQGNTPKFPVQYCICNSPTEDRHLRLLEANELARLLSEPSKAPLYDVRRNANSNAKDQ